MRGFADAKAKPKRSLYLFLFLCVCVLTAGTTSSHAAAQAGSIIGATVCAPSSTLTLAHPVSDSVVTESTVPLDGTVTQANQIVIKIDNVFDSIIPLTIGQTTFSSSVQLSVGTHTIEVTAVSTCPGASGSASSVVTYEAPPQTSSSTGTATPTDVGGVIISHDTVDQVATGGTDQPGLLGQAAIPFQTIAGWLNVNAGGDHGSPGTQTMSIGQAVVLTSGMYLSVIGMAPGLVSTVASFPVVANVLPSANLPTRMRWFSRGGRIAGLVMIFGSLFL